MRNLTWQQWVTCLKKNGEKLTSIPVSYIACKLLLSEEKVALELCYTKEKKPLIDN